LKVPVRRTAKPRSEGASNLRFERDFTATFIL
jgi:hypothetical protein